MMDFFDLDMSWVVSVVSKPLLNAVDSGLITFEQITEPDAIPLIRTITTGLPVIAEGFVTLKDIEVIGRAPFAMSAVGLRAFRCGVISREKLLELDDDTIRVYSNVICTQQVLELIEQGRLTADEIVALDPGLRTVASVRLLSIPEIDRQFLVDHPLTMKILTSSIVDKVLAGEILPEHLYKAFNSTMPGVYFAGHLLGNVPFDQLVNLPAHLVVELTPGLVSLIKTGDLTLQFLDQFREKSGPVSYADSVDQFGSSTKPNSSLISRFNIVQVRDALVAKVITPDMLLALPPILANKLLSVDGMVVLTEKLLSLETLETIANGHSASERLGFWCSNAGLLILRSGRVPESEIPAFACSEVLSHGVFASAFVRGELELADIECLRDCSWSALVAISTQRVFDAVKAGVASYIGLARMAERLRRHPIGNFMENLFSRTFYHPHVCCFS